MTTLVTGAGLIGTVFAQYAIARNEAIVFVDPEPRADFLRMKLGDKGYALVRADVRDLSALADIVKTHRVATIVHTAGLIGGRVQADLSAAFDINLGGTRNIAEAARQGGVRRLVHISSLAVYDRRREPKGAVREDAPIGQGRGYGNYKAAKELILDAYAAAYGFELMVLRPANVFGLGHYWAGSSGGQKMHNLISAGLTGETAHIAANDAGPSEYVYGRDVGRAVDLAATVPMPRERTFNIGSGVIATFDEVIAAAKAACPGLRCEVEPGASQAKPAPLDISRAKQYLGWEPRFTLRSAFEDYLAELKGTRGH